MNSSSYSNLLFSILLCFFLNAAWAHANSGIPTNKGSIPPTTGISVLSNTSIDNKLGHCIAVTIADTNCLTKTVELSAFVYYVFTGVSNPMVATWSNGQTAHKITVSDPGHWSWDATLTGCEPNHWETDYTLSADFFKGNLSIQGPAAICNADTATLLVESGGYNFPAFSWTPANPSGQISPYLTTAAGNYTLQVTDAMGCPFNTQITLLASSIIFDGAEQFFCPGDSIEIGGVVYHQSAQVVETIPSTTGGCDTIINHTLTFLPNPVRSTDILLCPGESVNIGGLVYNQAATVVDTVADPLGGCDAIVTYYIKLKTPSPSTININCPSSIVLYQPTGTGALVDYPMPTASSDCSCPGLPITLTNGLPSGSHFPDGVNTVCFSAKDACGQTATCCFNVAILEDGLACDIKENGCLKYELLTITEDTAHQRTYRIRVTNSCSEKLLYTAIQVPNGLVAVAPQGFGNYTAPSGNKYRVRNPNHSPFYSIRFTSLTDSIQNGESDILKYTLPAQADVTFIHILSRLSPNIKLEAHLNTFYCPIGVSLTEETPSAQRALPASIESGINEDLFLYPNPASQRVMVETGEEFGQLSLYDATGRMVFSQTIQESDPEISVAALPQGLYQFVFVGEKTRRYASLLVER